MTTPTIKLVTLGYLFDAHGSVLLMLRNKSPNKGLWSPPGGKIELGESPFECILRELREETGLACDPATARLIGLVAESDYEAPGANYLIFLYAFTAWSGELKPDLAEGSFAWHKLTDVLALPIPETDRQLFWPRILAGRCFSLRIAGGGGGDGSDPGLRYTEEPFH